jgi:hypothetical protein
LEAVQQAVDIYRHLAADRLVLNPPRPSITSLFISRISVAEKRPIQHTVDLRRQLAADRLAIFNADLALALNKFSVHLSKLCRREEALEAIQQAVDHHQQLAEDHLAAFNTELVTALNALAVSWILVVEKMLCMYLKGRTV